MKPKPILATEPLLACPTCGLPAEITDRFILDGAPTPVEDVKLVCAKGHWSLDGARGRARRRGELDGAPPVADGPARDLLVGLETRAELLDALARLTPRQRAVLVLRYFNDLTEAQTAEVLGCSPGTVKSNASRGLARLREVLAPIPHPTREL